MATHVSDTRFALRTGFDRRLPHGAWWPENRRLSDQLGRPFVSWLTVIPPETPVRDAPEFLDHVKGVEADRGGDTGAEQQPVRAYEGGHV